MRSPTDLRICLIGAGRLGRTIIRSFGRSITTVITRNLSFVPADSAGSGERFVVYTDLDDIHLDTIDVIWLAVPDDQIERMAERLSCQRMLRDQIVIHSAGGRGREVIAAHVPSSVKTAVLHPNAILDGTRGFEAGVVWGVTADPSIRIRLEELIVSTGGIPISVDDDTRPLYHAAATLTANYVKTLADAAMSLYHEIGIDNAIAVSMVRHYLTSLLANFDGSPLREHLTGPAARGDLTTLRAQRQQIAERKPQMLGLFDALVETTLKTVRPELAGQWKGESEGKI